MWSAYQRCLYKQDRNTLRRRERERRSQEARQDEESFNVDYPLFGEPYKTSKGDELSNRIKSTLGNYDEVKDLLTDQSNQSHLVGIPKSGILKTLVASSGDPSGSVEQQSQKAMRWTKNGPTTRTTSQQPSKKHISRQRKTSYKTPGTSEDYVRSLKHVRRAPSTQRFQSTSKSIVLPQQKPTAYVRPMDGQDQAADESPMLKSSSEAEQDCGSPEYEDLPYSKPSTKSKISKLTITKQGEVKIQGQNKEMLAAACQMFMGKSEQEIAHIALETLEGHQRAIMAHMTVEEIYKDRKKFSEQVFKVASSDLVNMGISVVSYTLKDVHDDQDYLHSLGKARTAQVQKDARIGEAMAKRDAVMREAHAMQEKVSAQYVNEIEMAKAQRDFELKKAAYDVEVAKTKQRIEEERMQVQVVERAQQIMLQEQEITRKDRELDAKVKKPADAERYRLERLAEAERLQLIMQAEAEAESIRIKGEAEAFAVEVKARAEAEQMSKKAEAFKQYKEAAMVDMLLEKLPLIAEEISKPLSEAKKVTMVSSGNGDVGVAKLTGEVLDIMKRLPEAMEKLTGVSITQVHTH
ncbi:UNVERIFIED_CONTAM: hypothetical protein FKN15_066022 [Acipenser sinensis]